MRPMVTSRCPTGPSGIFRFPSRQSGRLRIVVRLAALLFPCSSYVSLCTAVSAYRRSPLPSKIVSVSKMIWPACCLLQGFKQYAQAWRLRPLWMTRRSRSLLTITYPRLSPTLDCCQAYPSRSQRRFVQPSWGSRAPQRLTPLTAYGSSHDYAAWTSNLNAAQTHVSETVSSYNGRHSQPTPSAMQSGEMGPYSVRCIFPHSNNQLLPML